MWQADAAGTVTGSTDDIVSRLSVLADLGVQRIMLQYIKTDDMDSLEEISRTILPNYVDTLG